MTTETLWRKLLRKFSQGALACLITTATNASEYRGHIVSGGFPVPGVTITATHGGEKLSTTSDADGLYTFLNLADGSWTIEIQMQGFITVKSDVTVLPKTPAPTWELKILPIDQLLAQSKLTQPALGPTPLPNKPPEAAITSPYLPRPPQEDERSSDGFLVNGSSNNAATSKYSIDQAFGNSRSGARVCTTVDSPRYLTTPRWTRAPTR